MLPDRIYPFESSRFDTILGPELMKVNLLPEDPKKILHLTQLFGMGGLERVLLSLNLGLIQQGISSQVYVYDDDWGTATLARQAKTLGVDVHLEKKKAGFSWSLPFKLIGFCRQRGIRLIHTHDPSALIYGVFAKILSLGWIRIVHTQHSFVHLNRPRLRTYEKIFPRFADAIVCPSENNRQHYRELGYDPLKIDLIPNGVDFGIDEPSVSRSAPPAEVRTTLLPQVDRVWLLYLGRLYPGKGQVHWIDTWGKLNPRLRSRLCTLFVGPATDPAYAEDLVALARGTPDGSQLLFLGETATPSYYLNVCDSLISFSDFEGMPLTPVEAAGIGRPVVLSDIPGHRELGLPEGMVSFFRVPLNEGEEISRLERILESLLVKQNTKVENSAEIGFVRKKFGLETMVGKYRAVYSRVSEIQ